MERIPVFSGLFSFVGVYESSNSTVLHRQGSLYQNVGAYTSIIMIPMSSPSVGPACQRWQTRFLLRVHTMPTKSAVRQRYSQIFDFLVTAKIHNIGACIIT